jgi:flagella basal body P-ring formation protein FlgA
MLTLIFSLLVSIAPAQFEATTPAAAALKAAQQSGGSSVLLPQLSRSSFDGLPMPGPGIKFVARNIPVRTDGSSLPIEITAVQNDRVIAKKRYLFRVERKISLVVAKRTIEKGSAIRAVDVVVEKRTMGVSQERYAMQLNEVVGKVALGRILAGRKIALRHLRRTYVVRRGDLVMVSALGGGLQIKMKGKAVESAARGDRVRVVNPSSGRILQGIAVGNGLVRVEMLP